MPQTSITLEGDWFIEGSLPDIEDDRRVSLKVKKRLYKGKSNYQKIEVFDSFKYGRILALDDIIQLSEHDESHYHEMIIHPAICRHPNPKRILIVGGGDGGCARELRKHSMIEEIHQAEIDKAVIEISKEYLPFVSAGAFDDARVKVYIEDAAAFVPQKKNFYDIIIIDSTDPIGPSIPLFSEQFYKNCHEALTSKGIISIQTLGFSTYLPIIKATYKKLKGLFPSITLHQADIPCYHCGTYCFTVASKEIDLKKANQEVLEKRVAEIKGELKYYNPEFHFGSQILPTYAKRELKL